MIQAVDAELEIWDLKFGTESQHYQGKAHRVTTVDEAAARVDWLLDVEFPRRAALMAAQGTSSWKESPTTPAMVLMVDEGNVIIREFKDDQLKRFFRVAEQGLLDFGPGDVVAGGDDDVVGPGLVPEVAVGVPAVGVAGDVPAVAHVGPLPVVGQVTAAGRALDR